MVSVQRSKAFYQIGINFSLWLFAALIFIIYLTVLKSQNITYSRLNLSNLLNFNLIFVLFLSGFLVFCIVAFLGYKQNQFAHDNYKFFMDLIMEEVANIFMNLGSLLLLISFSGDLGNIYILLGIVSYFICYFLNPNKTNSPKKVSE